MLIEFTALRESILVPYIARRVRVILPRRLNDSRWVWWHHVWEIRVEENGRVRRWYFLTFQEAREWASNKNAAFVYIFRGNFCGQQCARIE